MLKFLNYFLHFILLALVRVFPLQSKYSFTYSSSVLRCLARFRSILLYIPYAYLYTIECKEAWNSQRPTKQFKNHYNTHKSHTYTHRDTLTHS